MSGVEAIFGIVTGAAGLISLGIELGESAAKLRRLYHAVRDAPKTIAGLAFDLETMAMALSELEKIRQRDTSSSAILSRCITRCQHSTAEIRQVVDKMECCIAKHSRIRGRLYTAFKERDVRDLLNDLEKARTSLHLAYTMYHSEQQMQRHHEHGNMLSFQGRKSDDIMRQLTLLVHSFTPPPQQQQHQLDTADNQYAETWLRATKDNQHLDRTEINLPLKRSYKENDTTHKRFQLRLPVWFCRRVWDLTISSAHCGWSMQLRTYNVIHQNSLIFGYCYAGDVVGAQRLLQSGGASPLDVYEEYPGRFETLIEAAASSGQLAICRYLLGQTTWPHQALNSALMYYGYRTHVEADAEVYRLFFKAPDFDPDVEDFDLPFWANWCMNPKCLDFILNFQFHFYDMPISERFEIAIRMHSSAVPPTCSDFVRLIGLSRTDHRLATLRTSNGETVLHYVARRLGFVVSRKDTRPLDEALQDWVSFGESILRMGADLCSLSTGTFLNDDWEMTPLMKFLDITFGWEPSGPLEAKVQHIRTWAGMIQQAGIDLCHYGVSETRVWRMLKSLQRPSQEALLDRMIMVEQILYGPTPVDWSLMVCFPFTTRVYELHPMPGAFNEDGEQPRKVIWKPTEAEEDEGPWDVVHSKATCSSRADLRDLAILSEAPFSQLLDATQDDHGVIMRLHYQISHAKRCSRDSRRRSHSQPPLLRRREAAYYAQLRSSTHSWLPPLHLCPFDSQWKVGCDPGSFQKHHLWGHGIYTVFNVRSCAKGVFEACASLQESQRWHDNSFLGLIRDCQHRSVDTGEPQSIRHAGTDTCPQGCSKIDLSQLNVPESLKSYHPQRWYEDDS